MYAERSHKQSGMDRAGTKGILLFIAELLFNDTFKE